MLSAKIFMEQLLSMKYTCTCPTFLMYEKCLCLKILEIQRHFSKIKRKKSNENSNAWHAG